MDLVEYCKHAVVIEKPPEGFILVFHRLIGTRGSYNNEHRHSRIRFVTPTERYRGLDYQVLSRRHELYERAKEKKPERWSGQTRNWEPIGTVLLNPDREQQIEKIAA